MTQSPESCTVETEPEIMNLNTGGGTIKFKGGWLNSGNIFSELLLALGWNRSILQKISSLSSF